MDALNQGNMTKRIDATYDRALKKLVGTEGNSDIAIKFITDVTGLQISQIRYLNNEIEMNNEAECQSTVNILCSSTEGQQIVIEIQRAKQRDFLSRILGYGSKVYSSQLKRGNRQTFDGQLKPTIVIAIVNFQLFTDDEFKHYSSRHRIVEDQLMFHFIELAKFNIITVDELSTDMDCWCFFLKNAHKLNDVVTNNLTNKFPWIKKAIDELDLFSADPTESLLYSAFRNAMKDREEELNTAKEAAKKNRSIEIAIKMKNSGMDITSILRCTDVTEEELEGAIVSHN